MPLAAKASIVYLMVSILQKGMAFLTSPLYTRLLTTEEYGQVTVYLSWQQLFGIVAMFCLSAGVFDVGMLEYKTKREEFVFSLLKMCIRDRPYTERGPLGLRSGNPFKSR